MSIEKISKTLSISRAHLMKIVNKLSTLDYVETVRGRSGGVRIRYEYSEINIGEVFRQLEEITDIVNCDEGPCLFRGNCMLKHAFKNAELAFLGELDQFTLEDLVKRRSHMQKIILQGINPD